MFFFAYVQSSSGSLSMLVRAVLLDKKPDEVPMVRFKALVAVSCLSEASYFLINLGYCSTNSDYFNKSDF